MQSVEPAWLSLARSYIGTREIPGVKHEPLILQWWRQIRRGGIKTDEVPWCAAFVGAMLEQVGIESSRFESARSYVRWGDRLIQPALGCIAVFQRESGGHVGFVVGKTPSGHLLILGGNQSNEVNIKAFSTDRLVSLRWPQAAVDAPMILAPVIAQGSADISTNEA